jgi:hypothetical protein
VQHIQQMALVVIDVECFPALLVELIAGLQMPIAGFELHGTLPGNDSKSSQD